MKTQNLPKQQQWTKNIIITLHTYAYSIWKGRNDILHKDSIKDCRKKKQEKLQQRVADLYGRGRANLTQKELNYFKVPVAVRQKKGLETMALWIRHVEEIFKKRGQSRQERVDTWLAVSTPERNWRDRWKTNTLGDNPPKHRQVNEYDNG